LIVIIAILLILSVFVIFTETRSDVLFAAGLIIALSMVILAFMGWASA
jgi:hypothetical protein